MVQSILFFVLGFLTAGFLMLLVAPAVWRRAVSMTRRRVEAKLPMTLEEIRADKDSLRAEHAMALRKVEVQLKATQEKLLSQAIELSRARETRKALDSEHAEKGHALSELEATRTAMHDEIDKRDVQVKALAAQLAEAERLLELRSQEIEEIGRLYDEATLSSSNRQIELVSREAEMGKLSDDMLALRNQRKDIDRRASELEVDNKALREALKAETKRSGEVDRKMERAVAQLSDRDDKLERRESELVRLRELIKRVQQAQEASAMTKGIDQSAERERVEARLTALMRENKRLKGELAQAGRVAPAAGEDAQLREQMHNLAAEVVALTARLEGPESPIAQALAAGSKDNNRVNGERSDIISLADRVRALQKSAPAE
ncbi:hypothetical protein [Mesorhizobium sp. ANAO-SY3R2]|uniref:hypothetical protein n=1 Tax=Mesorhizobium sp. ANAO-SY3R2 TaxID=3166644 RepID=UPI00366D3014